jgi:alpha-beta hydrolase superfamily lysophospholipase
VLLRQAGEPGPYVLVGHSLGGATMLDFARQFPDEVAGMALIDSMSPHQFTTLPDYASFYDMMHRASGLLPSVARLGVGRIVGAEYGVREARAFRDEIAGIPDALDDARELESIGDKPLIVLTAGKGQEAGWAAAQADLATLSTNSVQRLVPQGTHTSLLDDRADAAESSRTIRDVVRSARAANPPATS